MCDIVRYARECVAERGRYGEEEDLGSTKIVSRLRSLSVLSGEVS